MKTQTSLALPIDQRKLRLALRPRARDAHKGDFGHALIVGGDKGMAGAALMAGEACARTGAGKVSIATRSEHIPAFIARTPELMARSVESADDLMPLLTMATVVVIGPGLGQTDWSKAMLGAVLATDLPLVVDADALNLLALMCYRDNNDTAQAAKEALAGDACVQLQRDNWILTPHPGEASRLLNTSTRQIAEDRLQHAQDLQQRFQGVAVLKGKGSLIATPEAIYQCRRGNAGMASGGMGDVLSGIIGGLLAQGFSVNDAACFGVELHAHAADIAAKRDGERGLLATDLLSPLRTLLNP
ncbi:NAD(P)H-hydrate dehydratase [Leucothrix pacifica]|uniref:ADP-dependent (S)-NAD(P)H-hydrate dehydratase n=1 Tax=Leucothrix pacifica TaxID=1247513 RepID=A0A317CM46_9GAMM|nr:NAD(P)H-hydrate dehydratase [Leucothrix pacifica]PWQ97392.1 NAD(P)H-hydrate dehydratase [Leucothrix pacifica]